MWMSSLLMLVVALLHSGFMILEMFLWTKPATIARLGMTSEMAEASRVLAANQGLYNGFLAAGLVFALCNKKSDLYMEVSTFFLVCVIVAGIYGSLTARRQIIFVQTLPAALALVALWCRV